VPNSKKQILFISHEASRTGAPILLLNLLKWIKSHTNLHFKILLVQGGELDDEFRKIAPTLILSDLWKKDFSPFLKALPFGKSLSVRLKSLLIRNKILSGNVKLVYANSILSGSALNFLQPKRIPVITHIHELKNAFLKYSGKYGWESIKEYTDYFICCSRSVLENLLENQPGCKERAQVIYEFIPISEFPIADQRFRFREKYGISQTEFVIGSVGIISSRKGADLLIQVASEHSKKSPIPARFVWFGAKSNLEYFDYLESEVRRLKLENRIRFLGEIQKASNIYPIFDLFLLPSREDPFPLVCLEAAAAGLPIVCFKDSGGMAEFVGDDAGIVISDFDIHSMCDAVIHLQNDSMLRMAFGDNARKRVMEKCDIEKSAAKIVNLINNFL
jgi:glycosyltransferase involved in cell wall biosynthesis